MYAFEAACVLIMTDLHGVVVAVIVLEVADWALEANGLANVVKRVNG